MKKVKDERFYLRLTAEDKAILKYKAKQIGLTASELVRHLLMTL
jgi:hypothetical protein